MISDQVRKENSSIERLRKPISFALVFMWLSAVIAFKPKAFGTLYSECFEMLGYVMIIAAALGRLWSTIYIAGRKDRVLCQQGPYSLCRNPLYFFSFIGVVGFGFAVQHLLLTLLLATLFLAYYHYVIRSEETRLKALFETEFEDYKQEVPRFFPHSISPKSVDVLEVRPRIIERGMREIIWFLGTIVLAEIIEQVHSRHFLSTWILPF